MNDDYTFLLIKDRATMLNLAIHIRDNVNYKIGEELVRDVLEIFYRCKKDDRTGKWVNT